MRREESWQAGLAPAWRDAGRVVRDPRDWLMPLVLYMLLAVVAVCLALPFFI